MPEQDRDHRIRFVYSQLKSLADNPPAIAREHHANRYNQLVDELIFLGFEANGFKINRDRDMFRPVANINTVTGVTKYHDYYQVHHGELDRQIKALLTYFELVQNNTNVTISLPKREG